MCSSDYAMRFMSKPRLHGEAKHLGDQECRADGQSPQYRSRCCALDLRLEQHGRSVHVRLKALPPVDRSRGLRGLVGLGLMVLGLPFGWCDVSEAGMAASGVVSVDPGENGPRRASARVANRYLDTSSRLSEDQAASATALSAETPVRPTDWTTSWSPIRFR